MRGIMHRPGRIGDFYEVVIYLEKIKVEVKDFCF